VWRVVSRKLFLNRYVDWDLLEVTFYFIENFEYGFARGLKQSIAQQGERVSASGTDSFVPED
jgi:hypothetical protein